MNAAPTALRRVSDNSVAMQIVRGSVLCRAVGRAVRAAMEMRRRIGIGLAAERSLDARRAAARRLERLFDDSRLIQFLAGTATTLCTAFGNASSIRVLAGPIGDGDRVAAVRTGALVVVVAVLTHSLIFAVIGVPVAALGWTTRIVLLILGLAVAWRPRGLAAAWRDRAHTGGTPAGSRGDSIDAGRS